VHSLYSRFALNTTHSKPRGIYLIWSRLWHVTGCWTTACLYCSIYCVMASAKIFTPLLTFSPSHSCPDLDNWQYTIVQNHIFIYLLICLKFNIEQNSDTLLDIKYPVKFEKGSPKDKNIYMGPTTDEWYMLKKYLFKYTKTDYKINSTS